MIIKKLELNNFRQYKGKQTIKFSQDLKKNVTVLIGKNTSGKTTFVQAFNWCLYNKSNFKSKEIINLEASNLIRPLSFIEAYVEVVIKHENNEYIIRRTQRFEKNNANKIRAKKSLLELVYKDPSGAIQEIPKYEYEKTINKILPEELSDYFFFDGERLGKINNKGDVVSAVRALMGLDVVSEARDILDPSKPSSVTSKFNNELDISASDKNNSLKKNLKDDQDNLNRLNIQLKTCEDEIEYFERRKEELAKILMEKKEVKDLKNKEIDIDKDIKYLTTNIDQIKKRIKKLFGVNSVSYVALPAIYKAFEVLSHAKTDSESIPDMRIKAFDYIIRRGICLCGHDLRNDEEAVKNILHEKSLAPPNYIGTTIRNYKNTLKDWQNNSEDHFSSVMAEFENLIESKNNLENKKANKENLHKKILEIGDSDINQLENEYRKITNELKDKSNKKDELNRKIGGCVTSISKLNGNIERLAAVNVKNSKIMRYLDYSNEIFKWFEDSYRKEEKEVKEKLLESVNRNFKKMYHGNRQVTLNDRYHIELETKVGDYTISTDESKGLEAVKNFSFITGLVDLARERAQKRENDDNIFYSEPYPLVMDAPFSNVDEVHIDNIAKILPNSAEQVILILMNKDWEYAEKSIGNRIGEKYLIEKVNNSETYSCIKSV